LRLRSRTITEKLTSAIMPVGKVPIANQPIMLRPYRNPPQVLEIRESFVGRAFGIDQRLDRFPEGAGFGDRDQLLLRPPDVRHGESGVGDLAPGGDPLRPLENRESGPRLFSQTGLGPEALEPAQSVLFGFEEPPPGAMGADIDFPADFAPADYLRYRVASFHCFWPDFARFENGLAEPKLGAVLARVCVGPPTPKGYGAAAYALRLGSERRLVPFRCHDFGAFQQVLLVPAHLGQR
jgi:hypothetical protein